MKRLNNPEIHINGKKVESVPYKLDLEIEKPLELPIINIITDGIAMEMEEAIKRLLKERNITLEQFKMNYLIEERPIDVKVINNNEDQFILYSKTFTLREHHLK